MLLNSFIEPLKPSLKSVLSLRFEEEPDYNYYLSALKRCFKEALQETMPVSPPTFQESNYSDSLIECDELLANYDFEWKRSVPTDIVNKKKM